MADWNPRYVNYARVHKRTPEAMLKYDERRFPGGKMCGFILWMRKKWQEWGKLPDHGGRFPGSCIARQEAHDDFDAWLAGVKA